MPALPSDLDGFRAAVLSWFDTERRDLPFRATRDPYLVLVSEAMAQQTQIARVGEAWPTFVARFPTVRALADAPLPDVLRAWAGLGYNRRAVYLHRAARAIVDDHDGVVPDDVEALQALPGIGPYTARAVSAIAFGRPVGAVDTNVRRVLGRVTGAGSDAPAGVIQDVADAAVPPERPADWTAALMDVGARHCRPVPRCDACPARPWCATASDDRSDARGDRSRASRRAPRSARAVRVSEPFDATSRWLRGRLVRELRAAPGGQWHRLRPPIGSHTGRAVELALAALAADGLVEVHAADPLLARLAGFGNG